MKRAANILLLVGAIIAIVSTVLYLIAGIVFLVLGAIDKATMIQWIQDGTVHTGVNGSAEEQAIAVKAVFLVVGVVFLVLTAFSLADSIIAFKGRNAQTKTLYILNIVFGALSGVVVNLVGGILGVVAVCQEENRKAVENNAN